MLQIVFKLRWGDIRNLMGVLISIFVLSFAADYCSAKSGDLKIYNQIQYNEDVLFIQNRSVVFLLLSDDDFEKLVSEDPDSEHQLVEVISDFVAYAERLINKLRELGFKAELGRWKEINVILEQGKIEKLLFNPNDIIGIFMYEKKKPPKICTELTPHIESMASAISEYFEIDILRR
jgi:hypothetical protein